MFTRTTARGLIVMCMALMASAGGASADTIDVVRVASGLSSPLFATSPPGDTDRLFIVERGGDIEILDLTTGTVNGTSFLDITSEITSGNERGLLGLAFDPNYATNGYFYVNYTDDTGGDTVVARYSVMGDPATSNVADAGSGEIIIEIDQPQDNHNAGWIGFSPNDPLNLYIATGDGGGANDGMDGKPGHTPGTGNSQDITDNLLGKMLRLNPIRTPNVGGYTVPASNPFTTNAGDDEIWSFGLRNPFRASFDRKTGDLWIGDVGQAQREEIDFQPASSTGEENWGWRSFEGTRDTGFDPQLTENEVTFPVFEYDRSGAQAVTGGYVYYGPAQELRGLYISADFFDTNQVFVTDPSMVDMDGMFDTTTMTLLPDVGEVASIASFGEDGRGNLYVVDLGGEVFLIPEPTTLALVLAVVALLVMARPDRRRTA